MVNERVIVQGFLSLRGKTRYEAMLTILEDYGIPYTVQSCGKNCHNILINEHGQYADLVLVAHYDVYTGSLGINDNTCSLAVLLNLCHNLPENVKIVFTDKEETGMIGSSHYANTYKDKIGKVVVLDIIGYGDTLVYGTFEEDFSFLEQYGLKRIVQVLPSDNSTFKIHGVKVALITAAHAEDIIFYNDKYDLSSAPRFYESFHNRKKDNDISVIDFELIEQLRLSLLRIIKENSHKN